MSVLVGRQAPDFTSAAVLASGEIVDKFNFHQHISGKYGLVFFYPLDFTFVCPSELIALSQAMDEFEARGVEVVSVSIDSHFTHNAWRNTDINDGGIGPVRYPMASDMKHDICRDYGIEHPEAGVAFRAVFLVDKEKVVRAQMVNDLPLGRSIEEILRLVDALQFTEEHGEECPINWKKGKAAITTTPEGIAAFLKDNADNLNK